MSKVTNVQKVINVLLANTTGKKWCVKTIAKKSGLTDMQTYSALSSIMKKSAYTVTRKKVQLGLIKVWCYSLELKTK